LKLPAEVTKVSSSSSNATISLQYRIFTLLEKHCTEYLSKSNTPKIVKTAAARPKLKLEKYKPFRTSEYVKLCAALDPRIEKKTKIKQK